METIYILTNNGKLADYPAFRSRPDAENFIRGLGSNGVSLTIKEVNLWPLKIDPVLNKLDDDVGTL